jgi:hypothetical protein
MTATIDETKTDTTAQTEAPAKTEKKVKRPYVFTPYQAMKSVNEALEEAGSETKLQGPMLYQYAKQGKFKTHPAQVDIDRGVPEHEVRLEVDEESFFEWQEKFVATHVKPSEPGLDENTGDEAKPESEEPVVIDDKSETVEDEIDEDDTDSDDEDEPEAE